jgi:oxalate---CoA ligase
MPFNLGAIHELATGRVWDPARLWSEISWRVERNRALEVGPGDRVQILATNTPEFFAELLAVWIGGAAAIPVDAGLTAFELDNLARAAAPKLIVVTGNGNVASNSGVRAVSSQERGNWPEASPVPSLRLDDDALILFTSGSTGQPKGVVHTHRSLAASRHNLRQSLGVESYRRTLCLLPVYFGHGLICNCLFPLLSGCDLYLGPSFTGDVVSQVGRWIDQHRIAAMSSVPTLWRLALSIARRPQGDSLRRVHCGSAPLGADLWRRIAAWARTAEVINTYGITETASWLAGSLHAGEPRDGLIGRGWGSEIRISTQSAACPAPADLCPPDETGYVWIQTAALMKGYYQRGELTGAVVSGGWFFTGDMGFLDADGQLVLGGRAVDEINKGGLKVQPQDVENAAEGFEHIRDVCAFAVADEFYGQKIGIAFVMSDARPESLANFRRWMESRLSRHKLPSIWYLLDHLPRTARGKIQRTAIAELCAAQVPLEFPAEKL